MPSRSDGGDILRQFNGTCALITLMLRKVALSADLDEGLAAARKRKMIDASNEEFIRKCLQLNEQVQAGEEPDEPITKEIVKEMQACAIRLNSADSA
ncbi:MAG: hypothetical protein ACOYIK_03170 [Coriobacteriales bacterium]|jgi:hypothetical protein